LFSRDRSLLTGCRIADTSVDFDMNLILRQALSKIMTSPAGGNVDPLEQVNEWTCYKNISFFNAQTHASGHG
jgi:hypothetical protein